MLDIEKELSDKELVVKLEGRLDTATAPGFEEALEEEFDKAEGLTIDMENVDYISSAGLRVLLAAHKKMSPKEGMKVINVNETIMEIFDIIGFSDILTID